MVSTKDRDKINGQISNIVMQVTSEPQQIAVCINKENLFHIGKQSLCRLCFR